MARKPKVTATEMQEKYARRLKGATTDMEHGINRVDVSPGVKAAENIAYMREQVLKAFDEGVVEASLRGIDLNDWKDKFIKKGIPRIAAGVDASKDKTTKAFDTVLKDVETTMQKVDAMPKGGLQNGINRMVTNATSMHELAQRRKGRG